MKNQLGLHARPASMFVKMATRFKSDILVEKEGEEVNGKSIMGLMMLAAGPGSSLELRASGNQAEAVLDALEALVEGKFDED